MGKKVKYSASKFWMEVYKKFPELLKKDSTKEIVLSSINIMNSMSGIKDSVWTKK